MTKSTVKAELVANFAESLAGKSLIFFDYKGIDVLSLTELRQQCREHGSRIKIFKNTLLKRALTKQKLSLTDDNILSGMTAIVIADADVFSACGKALLVAEKRKHLVIKGGIHEAAAVDAVAVRYFAKIPSRTELYGMLVGALEGIVNNLVVALTQVAEKKQAQSPETAAAVKPDADAQV